MLESIQSMILSSQVQRPNKQTIIRNTAANGDDYYMSADEKVVVVYNSASYTQNIFLPPVGETVGSIVTVLFPDSGGGGTLADLDDSLTTWADLTNDADNEYAVLYNTGRGWAPLATDM